MQKKYQIIRNKQDKSITLSPPNYKYTIIWLHGLGDNPDGFSQYFQTKQSPLHNGARIKLLHAPIRPVTINNGMKMSSWYDIKSLQSKYNPLKPLQNTSQEEIKQSLAILDKHVQQQASYYKKQKNIQDPYKRIIVGGFSQGSTISLLYSLTSKNIIGGQISFSGHIFFGFQFKNLGKVPILIHHGQADNIVKCDLAMGGYKLANILQQKNVKIETFSNLGHSCELNQLQIITQWVQNLMK